MVDFSAGYVPPGVYVSSDTSTVATAVGVSPTVVCLVGPGLGFQTFVDTVSFPGTNTTSVLTQQGITQNTIVVSNGSTIYAVGTDYTLSATDGSNQDTVTTIQQVAAGSIPLSTPITISYQYSDASYFTLNQFGDFASFIGVYGTPFDVNGVIQSELSLAAQIAFQNGANQLYAVALSGSGALADQYTAAYALTATSYAVDIVVPVFGTGTITNNSALIPYISALNTHLNNAANDGFPRVAIFGVPEDFSGSTTPDAIAVETHNRRAALAWPNKMLYFNNATNATQIIGGSYLAAAYAGILANNPIDQGLTREIVASFSGINPATLTAMTTSTKNLWSSKGVAVLEPNRSGQLVVRHGVSTDPTSVTTREFSIVRQQDALFLLVQQNLDGAQLVGSPITSNSPLAVKGIIAGALETALGANIIQSYSNLAVRQQQLPNGDPTVIEATFGYVPTYPLNYITVTFSLDLTTGTISSSSDTAGGTSSQ